MNYECHMSVIAFKWIMYLHTTLNEMESSCTNVYRGNEKHYLYVCNTFEYQE